MLRNVLNRPFLNMTFSLHFICFCTHLTTRYKFRPVWTSQNWLCFRTVLMRSYTSHSEFNCFRLIQIMAMPYHTVANYDWMVFRTGWEVNQYGDIKKNMFVGTRPYTAHCVDHDVTMRTNQIINRCTRFDIPLRCTFVVVYAYHQDYEQVSFSLVFQTTSFLWRIAWLKVTPRCQIYTEGQRGVSTWYPAQ